MSLPDCVTSRPEDNIKNGDAPYFSAVYLMTFSVALPVVLYGCETWSLTLREEHRLRVFENRVLRRIFGPILRKVVL
jgi:hypothetical protein